TMGNRPVNTAMPESSVVMQPLSSRPSLEQPPARMVSDLVTGFQDVPSSLHSRRNLAPGRASSLGLTFCTRMVAGSISFSQETDTWGLASSPVMVKVSDHSVLHW